ncbi:MAG: hypothetical protein KZQ58_11660 [gamma proteobacterium symbiont of Bathyaustriella thionipta]|nr:hypothetical protein [gamma proteobacterium symbiont of Bathyaustriella thionipta]
MKKMTDEKRKVYLRELKNFGHMLLLVGVVGAVPLIENSRMVGWSGALVAVCGAFLVLTGLVLLAQLEEKQKNSCANPEDKDAKTDG